MPSLKTQKALNVFGIGFAATARQGTLLTIALTMEVLLPALTMALELREAVSSRLLVLFAFGLIALLYLATEELLVEAYEKPDSPLITSCFFVSFWLC